MGKPNSKIRRDADVVFAIIERALNGMNVSAIRADKMDEPGSITKQVIDAILTCDLCIADLTGHNPNVFYELAIAQAAARPVVLMKRIDQTAPFDVHDYRCIDYDLKLKNIGTKRWVVALRDQVTKVLDPAHEPPRLIPERVPDPPAPAIARHFFLSLDDREVTSFPTFIEGAVTLKILARTIVNLLGQYKPTFASVAKAGCDVKLLIVDPKSEAARHVYGNSYDLYDKNARMALEHLANLQQRYRDRIQVRFFSYVPTLSLVNVERREAEQTSVHVQLYFARGDVGRERRPIFRLYRSDPWYHVFCEEFDSIWEVHPPDRDVAAYLADKRP
jgi:hypothetical protein